MIRPNLFATLCVASLALIASGTRGAAARQAERPAENPPHPAFERDAEAARRKAVAQAKDLRIRGKAPFLKAAGMKAILLDDLEGAKDSFQGMVAAEPGSDEGYSQLASVAEMAGDHAEAAHLYTEALKRRPDLAGYYLERRGRVLFEAKRWELALADAEEGLKARPGNPDLLRLRAKSLINMGDLRRAADSYQESRTNGRRAKTGEDAWICSSLKRGNLSPTACGS